MKASDIITQLTTELPLLTNWFSNQVDIQSLAFSGGVVTATTATAHGMTVGRQIVVSGAYETVAVSSITRSGTTATVTLSTPHNLTEGYDQTVTISGADQAAYNGRFEIVSVPNRNSFTFEVSGSPATPATGTILYLFPSPLVTGYNGLHTITSVPTSTTFTYAISSTPSTPAAGTIITHAGFRISGAADLDRAVASYTKQSTASIWLFVVLDECIASKDRHTLNDGIFDASKRGIDYRQKIIQRFSIYAFIPTAAEISGRIARDMAQDLSILLFKSVMRKSFETGLSATPYAGVSFVSHNFAEYDTSYYIHQFSFEQLAEIVYEDTISPPLSVAFRNIELNFNNDITAPYMTTDINLDTN